MIRKNLYFSPDKKINPYYFDGQVIIREIFSESDSKDQEVYFVEFVNGALTTVHYHESEQFLIPLSGNGLIGEFTLESSSILTDLKWENFNIRSLMVGEIVLIRPYVLHVHGAVPGQNFSHISIRKMFEQKMQGDRLLSSRTQTIWAFDIIQKLLDPNESSKIADQLSRISEKVNENILSWLTHK